MTTATALVENETLDLVVPPTAPRAVAMPDTDNPIMAMAMQASANGDVDTLKQLLAIRDAEDARAAEAAFNSAFSKMQSEMPAIPKRGKGHGSVTYAKIEDVFRIATPVLSKHGLSLRHRIDTSEGVKVTAILAHVDGHSEENTFFASPDKSGSKNDIQAIGSTITYGRRYTAEAILGLTSHGEDDDAFAAGDSPKVAEWRKRIGETEAKKSAYLAVRADLVRDVDMSGPERAECERILAKLFAALPEAEKNA